MTQRKSLVSHRVMQSFLGLCFYDQLMVTREMMIENVRDGFDSEPGEMEREREREKKSDVDQYSSQKNFFWSHSVRYVK